MTTLLVGFDSAWTSKKSGSLVGVLHRANGTMQKPGDPQTADFGMAEQVILTWKSAYAPTSTIIMLDQPTIVRNSTGQRPVENIVGSVVSRRHGGMQPANTGRLEMFGQGAPVWQFLLRFGGPADPLKPLSDAQVFETYPVLTMIALNWMLRDSRVCGRLPKYNPSRRKTFSMSDWRHVL